MRDQQKPSQAQLESAQTVKALSPNPPNGAKWGLGRAASLERGGEREHPEAQTQTGVGAWDQSKASLSRDTSRHQRPDWFPELAPQAQLLSLVPGEGSSQDNGLKDVSSED